jgi:hypothetical protein
MALGSAARHFRRGHRPGRRRGARPIVPPSTPTHMHARHPGRPALVPLPNPLCPTLFARPSAVRGLEHTKTPLPGARLTAWCSHWWLHLDCRLRPSNGAGWQARTPRFGHSISRAGAAGRGSERASERGAAASPSREQRGPRAGTAAAAAGRKRRGARGSRRGRGEQSGGAAGCGRGWRGVRVHQRSRGRRAIGVRAAPREGRVGVVHGGLGRRRQSTSGAALR